MRKMKAYILYNGDQQSNLVWTLGENPYTPLHELNNQQRILHTPGYEVLVDHPDVGWILFDTGLPDEPAKSWKAHQLCGCIITKDETCNMSYQLKELGLKPEDIKHVIYSHMHCDHMGNHHLFADTADFYCGKAEAEYAFCLVMQNQDEAFRGWYNKEEVLLPVKAWHYLDRDEKLFPGVEIVQLPGHTPGSIGMLLHTENGTMFFTGDAASQEANYNGVNPGASYDQLLYAESMRKMHDLQKRYSAKMFFSHDAEHIHSLKKVPDYYE